MQSTRWILIAGLTASLTAACGGGSSSAVATTKPTGATTAVTAAAKGATATTAGTVTTTSALALPAAGKPKIAARTGTPPTELQSKDITVGTGAEATAGSMVSVHYVGAHFATGEQFDASWDGGKAFSFTIGAGKVIKGWDQGVAGMKVGGRRELVIPPALAYGDRGAGAAIKPGETLVFVVDLVAVTGK